jgi:hypothetical protein
MLVINILVTIQITNKYKYLKKEELLELLLVKIEKWKNGLFLHDTIQSSFVNNFLIILYHYYFILAQNFLFIFQNIIF